ncbi:MAG: TIGR02757 family protein [Deltaproteobacteria bacterium]|nr:TIGR02757 family protein [Deltaproteobacteria bacterium]
MENEGGYSLLAALSKERLEAFYRSCNCREYVHPDPLEFLYPYSDPGDRELVGLIASSLAYGRVAQILKSVSTVLEPMGPSPCAFLRRSTPDALKSLYRTFKHRFSTGEELVALLLGTRDALDEYGSLEECFLAGLGRQDDTIFQALCAFVKALGVSDNGSPNSLLPLPERGSACKRLNLYLRWMARQDDVDPGGWNRIPLSKLIIPLDTHMHKISVAMGFTKRRQADMRTAIEVTRAFQKISPEDPVRYDFVLTRLGIREDMDLNQFLHECGACPI